VEDSYGLEKNHPPTHIIWLLVSMSPSPSLPFVVNGDEFPNMSIPKSITKSITNGRNPTYLGPRYEIRQLTVAHMPVGGSHCHSQQHVPLA
jgi:hypothetical protein